MPEKRHSPGWISEKDWDAYSRGTLLGDFLLGDIQLGSMWKETLFWGHLEGDILLDPWKDAPCRKRHLEGDTLMRDTGKGPV